MKHTLEGSYTPSNIEEKLYTFWKESGFFKANIDKSKESYSIVIPPPNVTGVLHMGHGLNNTLQDILIRFHRMLGKSTLWMPGTDHAGIATQNVVERRLKKDGKTKYDLGREEFIKLTWEVKKEHHSIITKQLEKIGCSLDWDRERFTLDEGLSNAVREVFVELYNEGLKQRFEKYTFFVKAVEGNLDVTTHEKVEYDRRKAPYLQTKEELQKMWLAEIKNEYVNQILNDKSPKEAKKRLKRRYEAALSKIAQTKSEDVFSTFENAFATAIDPHTSYLSPEDSENFNDDINLSLEGIGAVLTSEDEFTVINSLLPGSPAELTKKLKPKDKIVGVTQEDGSYEDIIGWRLNDVVKKIKGPKGSKVTLDIERDGSGGASSRTFQVTIVRDKIRLQDREAKGEVKEVEGNKIGVITIKSFYTDLNQDIRREIDKHY